MVTSFQRQPRKRCLVPGTDMLKKQGALFSGSCPEVALRLRDTV
jgi:hypothetical protein